MEKEELLYEKLKDLELPQGKEEDYLKVLIADPDYEFSLKLKNKLEHWYKEFIVIHSANSKEDIFRHLQGQDLDFLITEVLWDEDPADFIMKLSGEPVFAEIPIVVITSYDEVMFEEFLYKLGVLDFFPKKDLNYSRLEYKLRNYFRLQFHNKILYKHVDTALRKLEITKGITEEQIQELREMVLIMKEELEREYKNKMRLEEEKKKIQSLFGLYVDPNIINGVLSGEIPLEQKGVEREISVLFADIRGYTTLTERLSPTDIVAFLNEFFTAMTEVILGYNGLIDKYVGDAIMAIFGAPLPRDDHRDLAIQAAMEMQSIFILWNENWKRTYNIDASMGIGLASGIATLGNFGSFQKLSYTAIGDTVNIASRLEAIAGPGEVVVNDNLVENLSPNIKERYTFMEIPGIELKGKTKKVMAYKVFYR